MFSKLARQVAPYLTLLLAVGFSLPAISPVDDPPPPEDPPDPVPECVGCVGITSPDTGTTEVYDPTNGYYLRLEVQLASGSCSENGDPEVPGPCMGSPCIVTVDASWRVVAGTPVETCLVLPPPDSGGEQPEPHCYQRTGNGDNQGVERTQPMGCQGKLFTYRLGGSLPNLGPTMVFVQAKCTQCQLVLQPH